jgi:hypothetical protein
VCARSFSRPANWSWAARVVDSRRNRTTRMMAILQGGRREHAGRACGLSIWLP